MSTTRAVSPARGCPRTRRARCATEFVRAVGVLSRRPRQPFDEVVRDRFARREGNAGLGRLQAGGRDFFGMFGDGAWKEIQPALLAERRIARDDRAADLEPRHVVSHDLLRFRQGAGQNRAQQFQRGSEGLGRRGNVGVVVGYRRHGCVSASDCLQRFRSILRLVIPPSGPWNGRRCRCLERAALPVVSVTPRPRRARAARVRLRGHDSGPVRRPVRRR